MMTRWDDFENAITVMDVLRRRMNRLFEEFDAPELERSIFAADEWAGGWPRMRVQDTGSAVVIRAEVPGLGEKDVNVTVTQDVLTISGERSAEVPKGYTVHRQERQPVRFSRSIALSCKVDLEKTTAVVKDGLLHVTLPKAPESQPRQISVRAQ